jgi:putative transposase
LSGLAKEAADRPQSARALAREFLAAVEPAPSWPRSSHQQSPGFSPWNPHGFSRGGGNDFRLQSPLDPLSESDYSVRMKLAVQLQLLPDAEQAKSLRAIVERFNEAANWVAAECFAREEANQFAVRKFAYREVRERFGMSSQMAQLAIKNVCDAYKRDKTKRVRVRKHAAIVYDQRTMSFKGIDRVSLLTLSGRTVVPFVLGKYQAERFTHAKGQADLVLRKDGKWFLLVTVDVPDGAPVPATDFIGVDFGIARIATTSDGETFSGTAVEAVRRKHNLQRKRLGRRNTKGAKKKLKRVAGKETRFRRHENHLISKRIVETARRTGRGIALEDLRGIRERTRARGGDARNRLSGWSFGQLFADVSYKAQLAGVPVVTVDPRNTSRTCAVCGHCEKANRKSQSEFSCRSCGHRADADVNAALNLKALAERNAATGLAGPRA